MSLTLISIIGYKNLVTRSCFNLKNKILVNFRAENNSSNFAYIVRNHSRLPSVSIDLFLDFFSIQWRRLVYDVLKMIILRAFRGLFMWVNWAKIPNMSLIGRSRTKPLNMKWYSILSCWLFKHFGNTIDCLQMLL